MTLSIDVIYTHKIIVMELSIEINGEDPKSKLMY
jgi:hypothetical protein